MKGLIYHTYNICVKLIKTINSKDKKLIVDFNFFLISEPKVYGVRAYGNGVCFVYKGSPLENEKKLPNENLYFL